MFRGPHTLAPRVRGANGLGKPGEDALRSASTSVIRKYDHVMNLHKQFLSVLTYEIIVVAHTVYSNEAE